MKQTQFTFEVIEKFRKWLRPEGIQYLRDIIEKHGTILAVWNDHGIPHPVHFREGMQIRNWMRDQPEFKDMEPKYEHWFDNNWAEFTERALKDE